jgi:uncharacterized HAD superfamily protein
MNIGIDVDGVLVDLTDYQIGIGAPYFKKRYGYEIIDPKAYDVKDIFGCTEKERIKFGWRTIWKYIIRFPARDNASEVIRKLKNEGHRIIIITGRVYVKQNKSLGQIFLPPSKRLLRWIFRSTLKNWLKRRNIPYDEIVYCSEFNSHVEKYLACKEYEIGIMVEDKTEVIMALSTITKVICFDCTYNQDCEGENIIRAHDWKEVYRLIL